MFSKSTFLWADKRFLSSVQPLVGLQLTALDERFPTVWVVTQIRPLSCTQTRTSLKIETKLAVLAILLRKWNPCKSSGYKGNLTRVCPLMSLQRLFSGKHAIADVAADAAGWGFPLTDELSDGLSPRTSSSNSILTPKTQTLDYWRIRAFYFSHRNFVVIVNPRNMKFRRKM